MSKTERGIALVTGASSGVGLVTAQALRCDGYRVFGTMRRFLPESFVDKNLRKFSRLPA